MRNEISDNDRGTVLALSLLNWEGGFIPFGVETTEDQDKTAGDSSITVIHPIPMTEAEFDAHALDVWQNEGGVPSIVREANDRQSRDVCD